jgi:hypothetical protein
VIALRLFAGIFVGCLGLGCTSSGSDDAIGRRTCVALRDHLVELRLEGAQPGDLAAHREAMQRALGDGFVDDCLRTKAAEVRCALGAKDLGAVADCGPRAASAPDLPASAP